MKLFIYAERVCGIAILLLGLYGPHLSQLNRVAESMPESLHLGPWIMTVQMRGKDAATAIQACVSATNPSGVACRIPLGSYVLRTPVVMPTRHVSIDGNGSTFTCDSACFDVNELNDGPWVAGWCPMSCQHCEPVWNGHYAVATCVGRD